MEEISKQKNSENIKCDNEQVSKVDITKKYSLSKRDRFRIKCVTLIYQFELFQEKFNIDSIFEEKSLTKEELKYIKYISSKYTKLKSMILKSQSKNWLWERINPLQRSFLLFATFELFRFHKNIAINETIKLMKIYMGVEEVRSANGILDNIATKINEQKAN